MDHPIIILIYPKMNQVQIWFLIVAGVLALGIPFMFIGIQLPIAMEAAMLAEAAEYVILDEEDQNFWAEIPGRMNLLDIKDYYIFNCTNPEDVAISGVSPKFEEVGPFRYQYVQKLTERKYNDDEDIKNTKVTFQKTFNHVYKGDQSDLKKEYRVINLSGMKQWVYAKTKPQFKLAIEGFFETFSYSKHNFVRDLLVKDLVIYYANPNNCLYLTEGLNDVKRDVRIKLCESKEYGLMYARNVYEWSQICETLNPRMEHEIYGFFGFSISSFIKVKERFCSNLLERYSKSFQTMCDKIKPMLCSHYNISYHQWMYGDLINGKSYKNVTYKHLFGIYEFAFFKDEFMKRINPIYKEQFANIKWNDKDYHNLLDTHHEYPDYKTDPASVLLYSNMMKLFMAGKATINPFTAQGTSPTIDLYRFEQIANILKVSKEQAFMLYAYFDYYVNNTVILQDMGGDSARERIGNFGAFVLKDISDYCSDYLDVVLYTRALANRVNTIDCSKAVKYYFTIKQTESIMSELTKALCENSLFNTNVSNPVGLKHFVEASSYPYDESYNKLYNYLSSHIHNFTNEILGNMTYNNTGNFYKDLNDIKIKVKSHYQSVSNKKACANDFSQYCTKKQLFFSQFQDSYITKHPYPESKLPSSDYLADWWRIILEYIDYNEHLRERGDPILNVTMPDKPIEIPMEIPFLEKYYKSSGLTREDLYECFNYIELFDTDVLYSLLLKIEQNKAPTTCKAFGTRFFYNSTRYFIRNIQFGPMFNRVYPEDVYFEHFDQMLNTEHKVLDYLEGDDCTVDPSIGYGLRSSNVHPDFKTYDYFNWKHKMYTGLDNNRNIRKYLEYHSNTTIFYRRLVQDINGDDCKIESNNPFMDYIASDVGTDGFQYPQYGGKTAIGDTLYVIDSDFYRPLRIVRKTDKDYSYGKMETNDYVIDFNNDYFCPGGINTFGVIDMTSFYQYKAVITPARYTNISESSLNLPNVRYKRIIEEDEIPSGLHYTESYYVIEPYTGITMKRVKKIMSSLVLYYDILYISSERIGRGEFVPYYSMYENYTVSLNFANNMMDTILSMKSTRRTISITFTILGLLFIIGGISMIVRSCFFDPNKVTFDDEYDVDEIRDMEESPPNTTPLLINNENEERKQSSAELQPEPENTALEVDAPGLEQPEVNNENDEENLLP